MHLVVLGSSDSWYLRDLQRAAGARHTLAPATFRDLRSSLLPGPDGGGRLGAGSGDVDFRAADAFLVRAMPPGSLEQVIFRMDVLGRLAADGLRVVNPPRAVEAAVDKYLASALLHAAGLRVPRTIVCQTRDDAVEAFHALGGDVVIKPLFGSEGRGLVRVQDEGLAERTASLLSSLGAVLYMQEFVPHEGWDLRVLCIGEKQFAARRVNPHDWRTNCSRGAQAEAFPLTPELCDLATKAAQAIGAPLAGVDLLPSREGGWYVLEVNAVPGWQSLSAALEIDIAAEVLRYLDGLAQ